MLGYFEFLQKLEVESSAKLKGYRWVTSDLKSEHGKVQWRIGERQKQEGNLKLCENGFHASREPLQSLKYIFGERWFLCEAQGKIIEDDDKFVASEMRLTREIPNVKKLMVQFAVDCAKRCLPNFEKRHPEDRRPRLAIEAAEAWLKNQTKENMSAAKSAAESAESAGSAVWSAAESAWSAAKSAKSAGSAAESVAESARSAAKSAAESARSATWSAAESAWSAEKLWQNKHLKQLIKKELKK